MFLKNIQQKLFWKFLKNFIKSIYKSKIMGYNKYIRLNKVFNAHLKIQPLRLLNPFYYKEKQFFNNYKK